MTVNLFQKALDEVRYNIPEHILNLAFVKRDYAARRLPVSVDSKIRELVIRDRVMVDCNLVGGLQVLVPLYGITPETYDNYDMVYRIPRERLQNRTISSVLSVGYYDIRAFNGLHTGALYNSAGVNAMTNAAGAVFDASMPLQSVSTAYVELIGENTVLVRDTTQVSDNLALRCVLEYDEVMSSIKPSSYHDWCKLVVLATKAYIFNNLIVQIDQAYLQGGQELGRIREIIDGYADSNELYMSHLNDVWRKASIFNDVESKQRHLRMLMARR